MITSRGGTGKGRPDVQHGGSVGSFWPSGAKAGKNTGFSANGMREGSQLSLASPQGPGSPSHPCSNKTLLCPQHWPWARMGSWPTGMGVSAGSPPSLQPGTVLSPHDILLVTGACLWAGLGDLAAPEILGSCSVLVCQASRGPQTKLQAGACRLPPHRHSLWGTAASPAHVLSMAELSTCCTDCLAHKVYNIYCPALSRKSWLASAQR